MRELVIAAMCAALSACASYPHGVDARDAGRLASGYMFAVLNIGCGGVGAPVLRGDHWEVPLYAGLAGNPQHPNGWIHVDRSSGVVSYSYEGRVYPTLTPKELWRRL